MKKIGQDTTDTKHLRSLLKSYTHDLTLTFLERRGKYNNHKSTILEELQDVINELTHREKDLLTAVQVALSVLDSNDKLQLKLSKTKSKLFQALDKVHHQNIEIETLQESLITAENRYENLNRTLVETEELMLENSAELNRLVRERFQEAAARKNEDDIDLLTKEYRMQIQDLQKKRWELEKDKNQLIGQVSTQEKVLNDYREICERLEGKVAKFSELVKEADQQKLSFKGKFEHLETQNRLLTSNYERLKNYCERLEEDLSISVTSTPEKPKKISHSLSLQSELEVIEDQLEEYNEESSMFSLLSLTPSDAKCKTPQTRTSSLTSYFKLLSTDTCPSIAISPERLARKKPPEEYFALSVQAVKMNSPHMDNLISVSASDLYEKAIKAGIPFHKWYMWIESQLNTIYVQTIYKKNRRTLWKRYSSKVCLGY